MAVRGAFIFQRLGEGCGSACKMAQQVKVLVAQPDSLSSISRTHVAKGNK